MITDGELIIFEEMPDVPTEVYKCYQYLALHVMGKSQETIAAFFGVDRSTLFRWRRAWETGGEMDRAAAILLLPIKQKIEDATRDVLKDWPDIIRGIAQIARGVIEDGPNEKPYFVSPGTRILAFEVLNERVVQPYLRKQSGDDKNESDYARSIMEQGALLTPSQLISGKRGSG